MVHRDRGRPKAKEGEGSKGPSRKWRAHKEKPLAAATPLGEVWEG